jgi:glycosyltransferase involved in cell wall biosynthesis
MAPRLLIVSPVRNEASHIERVALALDGQTRRPDLWIVVDDQSTDETPQILARLAERLDFMSVMQSPRGSDDAPKDRLALGIEARSFNAGLNSVPWGTFTHIAKLDGDIELPPRYFELLLDEFAHDSALGLAGGVLRERDGEGWARGVGDSESDYHVRGALKCYTRDCLRAIGGIEERMAWDTIDEVYARMRGYNTRTMSQLIALHHRPCASADGLLRGRARGGRGFYIAQYSLAWVLARAVKTASERPVGLSGLAFLAGYLWAGVTGVPRVDDPEFRAFVRRERGARVRRALSLRTPMTQPGSGPAPR